MRIMVEFKCEDGHINERLVDSECTHIPCLDCDKIANRIVSAVRSKLDPISGDFMGATRQVGGTEHKSYNKSARPTPNRSPA